MPAGPYRPLSIPSGQYTPPWGKYLPWFQVALPLQDPPKWTKSSMSLGCQLAHPQTKLHTLLLITQDILAPALGPF